MENITGYTRLTVEEVIYEVSSPLFIHAQHWNDELRRSSACLKPGSCNACEIGLKRQEIGLICVRRQDNGEVSILRFPTTTTNLVRHFQEQGSSIIGTLLAVAKHPSATQTAPIVANLGRVQPRPIPCTRYIQSIGMKAARDLERHLMEADARAR